MLEDGVICRHIAAKGFMSSKLMLFFVVGAAIVGLGQNAFSAPAAKVTMDASAIDSAVPAAGNLRHIATGGFTPSFKPTPSVLWKLRTIGTRRMRLINVEWDNRVRVAKDGSLDITWSNKLEHELRLCKTNGWIPHIIVGQTLPQGVGEMDGDRHIVGPVPWTLYERYLDAFLRHVTQKHGFSVSEWEVGNEMDNPKNNWLVPKSVTAKLDPRGYSAYLKLYAFISRVVQRYRTEHASLKILVGGPAVTQNSMNHVPDSERNWIVRFANDSSSLGLACDFVSMHYYGSDWSGNELATRIGWIRAALAKHGKQKAIWITEWGADPFYMKLERRGLNYDAISGAFSLAFMEFMAGQSDVDAIFLAAMETEGMAGPALFRANGTPAHAFIALTSYAKLKGERLACTIPDDAISCVATRDGDEFNVLLWHLDWRDKKIGASLTGRFIIPQSIFVDLQIKGRHADRFMLRGLWLGDGDKPPGRSALPATTLQAVAEISGDGPVSLLPDGIELPYGGYAHLTFVRAANGSGSN
jgi:hypothetical protein